MNLHYFKSYAKVNIGLQILNKRPDGYHNINTLFQEIDLYDSIEIEKIENGCNFVSNVDWLKIMIQIYVSLLGKSFLNILTLEVFL